MLNVGRSLIVAAFTFLIETAPRAITINSSTFFIVRIGFYRVIF
jgi:hypothetical protein